MKKIMPLKINFVYVGSPDSERRLRQAYNRIFTIAKQSLLEKSKLKSKDNIDL